MAFERIKNKLGIKEKEDLSDLIISEDQFNDICEQLPNQGGKGRPTKYNPDTFPRTVIREMAKGRSMMEVCNILGINTDTFYKYTKEYKEFSVAYIMGKELARGWWDDLTRRAAMGEKANVKALGMAMFWRFGLSTTAQEHKVSANVEVENKDVDMSKYSKEDLELMVRLADKGKVDEA